MKRIRDLAKYQRAQQRRMRRSERQRARIARQRRKQVPWVSRKIKSEASKETRLKPPSIFSLTENPEAVIDFFDRFDDARRSNDRLFIDLEHVERLTMDALLLLLSRMRKKGSHRERCRFIGGNEPTNEKVRTVFSQSGFYSHISNPPQKTGVEKIGGIFAKHAGKRVRQDVCADIVHFATERLFGVARKNGGVYRTLIECMANTKDHASLGAAKPQSWWTSVYYDPDTKIAHFAFLDNGVGISIPSLLRSAVFR